MNTKESTSGTCTYPPTTHWLHQYGCLSFCLSTHPSIHSFIYASWCRFVSRSLLIRGALLAWFGPSRRLGHDDLVDSEYGDGCIGSQLHRPRLGVVMVEYAVFDGVDCGLGAAASAALNIDAGVLPALLMCRVERRQHVCGVLAGIVREDAGHCLECFAEFEHGILVQPRHRRTELLQLVCDFHFGGPRARDEAPVPRNRTHTIHSVIDGPFHFVEYVWRGAPQHYRGHPAARRTNHRHLGGSDLFDRHVFRRAELVGQRGSQPDHGGRPKCAAQTTKLKLGLNFDGENVVFVAEVLCDVGYVAAAHYHLHTSVTDRTDRLLHFLFLLLCEVQQLLGVVQQHSALRLGPGELDAT
mmetsp:Transcript_13670/g.32549  ORF Transcript_13670/g.32549 Transcript_13670/m.32549 type:complete len:355 (-) Transcript_13670:811-1875(-)